MLKIKGLRRVVAAARRVRPWIYCVAGLLVLLIVALAIRLAQPKKVTTASRSADLSGQINEVKKKYPCVKGLKQLNSLPAAAASDAYSRSAREDALLYLTTCTAVAGNKTQALKYANQLSKLYQLDGVSGANKQMQLSQLVKSIQGFSK